MGPACLAFGLAFLITSAELVTGTFPRLAEFALRRWQLWVHAGIYGLISFGGTFLSNVIHVGIGDEAPGTETNPWLFAVAVGLSTRALLQLSLFNVHINNQAFPVGLKSFVNIFEPWLLDGLRLDVFASVQDFLRPYAAQWGDLEEAKRRAKESIPAGYLDTAGQQTLEVDIDQASTSNLVMQIFLRKFGKRMFRATFEKHPA